jgi:hypothetical protein
VRVEGFTLPLSRRVITVRRRGALALTIAAARVNSSSRTLWAYSYFGSLRQAAKDSSTEIIFLRMSFRRGPSPSQRRLRSNCCRRPEWVWQRADNATFSLSSAPAA